jgi:hypothetical protein
MEVSEIIIKNELTTQEMEFVVEEYIFEKKSQRVTINTTNHPMARMVPPQMAGVILQQQFQLLDTAYQKAAIYFSEKLNIK